MAYKPTKLTRDQYKGIKRKDHNQMTEFVTEIYNLGRDDGIKEAKKTDIRPADIEEAIAGVRGIGEAKLKAIMERIYNLYEEAGKRAAKTE